MQVCIKMPQLSNFSEEHMSARQSFSKGDSEQHVAMLDLKVCAHRILQITLDKAPPHTYVSHCVDTAYKPATAFSMLGAHSLSQALGQLVSSRADKLSGCMWRVPAVHEANRQPHARKQAWLSMLISGLSPNLMAPSACPPIRTDRCIILSSLS